MSLKDHCLSKKGDHILNQWFLMGVKVILPQPLTPLGDIQQCLKVVFPPLSINFFFFN